MAYRLRRKESVERGVRRIAVEQIDLALAQIEDSSLDREEAVHQVRKHCKKLRGLLRLVRPQLKDEFPRENACYRDAARELSSIRDAGVLLEAWDKLADRREGREESSFGAVRAALEQNWRRAEQDGETIGRLPQVAQTMRQARERASGWSLRSGGFSAIAGGLKTTYRRGRRAMQAAHRDPTAANFHEWRKWTKYHWYHMRLLRNLWPVEMAVRRDAAKELSDLLGDEHDLALLRDALLSGDLDREGEFDVQPLLGRIERRRLELQTAARPLGLRLFTEKSSSWIQRCQGYWKAWKKEGGGPGARLSAGA